LTWNGYETVSNSIFTDFSVKYKYAEFVLFTSGEEVMGEEEFRCEVGASAAACISLCRIDAVVTVDERGQLILPKDVREKAGIKAGDRLALISCEKEGRIECISLLKADKLSESLKKTLGPLLQDILR